MAIKISSTTVIDNSRNFIGAALTATSIYANGTVGTARSVLSSTGSGIEWVTGPSAAITVLTSNDLLSNGASYMLNAPNIVLTLPSSPSAGDAIDIYNNVSGIHTLARNGSTIMNLSEDMTFGEQGLKFKIWYTGSTWSLF